MSTRGIVAYTAEEKGDLLVIHKAYAGKEDMLETNNWDELVDFLTEDKGKAIHICWSLYHFADIIFSLLPRTTQRELEAKTKVFVGDTKIFNTDRLLGITVTRQLKENFYSKTEVNLYSISHWLPGGTEIPTEATKVEQLGYEILAGLEKMVIYPTKLPSPIGVFADQLNTEELPTIFNFNLDCLEAVNWADQVARYEWRQKYNKKGGYHYDLTSAYPYFMANLPDTRHGKVSHSNKWQFYCDWGIVSGKLTKAIKASPLDRNAKYFTTEEALWGFRHGCKFELYDGWYFNFDGGKPYEPIINKLLEARQNGDIMASSLARKTAQGLSGKLDQYNKDGTIGELYNPILALMVRSRCRLAVADFIYKNKLEDNLIEVQVDGVTSNTKLELPATSKPGEWRIDL